MGTPIVDLNSLTSKLVAILTKPNTKAYYGQMLTRLNVDRQHWLDHPFARAVCWPCSRANPVYPFGISG